MVAIDDVDLRATDRAGNLLSTLPDVRLGSLTLNLTGPGRLDLGVPLDAAREFAAGDDREVQLWYPGDTAPTFVGVPSLESKTKGARSLSVPVFGLESYFDRLFVGDLAWSATEQFDIAWGIIADAQARTGGGRNIDANVWTPSGVTRDDTYHAHNLTTVGEALDAFRGLVDGFDWTIIATAADVREWTPYYPARGTDRTDWPIGFGDGTNTRIVDYAATRDYSRVATRAYVTGAGTGPDRAIGSYTDPDVAAGTRDLVEIAQAGSTSTTTEAVLDSHAQTTVEARSEAVWVLTEVDVVGPDELIDQIRPGDTLPVVVDDGAVQVDGSYRVVSASWPPARDRVTLTVQPA